jgi:hypothetical protein
MDNLGALNFVNVGFVQFMLEAEQQYTVLLGRERRRRRHRTCWVRNLAELFLGGITNVRLVGSKRET